VRDVAAEMIEAQEREVETLEEHGSVAHHG
jgi:hypothetical protein